MRNIRREFTASPTAMLGFVLVLAVVVGGVFAPLLSPHDPEFADLSNNLIPPFTDVGYPLGTDQLGRDIFSRLLYGARISLAVGLAAVLISALIGTGLGVVAGYAGRWTDSIIMRLADIQYGFPGILLAILFMAILGPSITNLIIILGISGWMTFARIARAQVMIEKEKEYVEGARAVGAGDAAIIVRHILPNIIPTIVVYGTLQIAYMILAEAGLSFLGLGVRPGTPTWGSMLNEGRMYMANAGWIAMLPGLAIAMIVLGINLLGDWLRDVADPRL